MKRMPVRFFCAVLAALQTLWCAAADQSVKAAAEPSGKPGERIFRWYHRDDNLKVYTPPEGSDPRMYARVTIGACHAGPAVIAFTTDARGTYMPAGTTYFLSRRGCTTAKEYWKTGHKKGWAPFKRGETSGWIDITRALRYGYTEVLFVNARRSSGYHSVPDDLPVDFRIEFSTDAKTVIGTFESGGGRLATGLISLARGEAISDAALSEEDLSLARQTGKRAAKRPRRFMVGLANAISPSVMTPRAYTNELKALCYLGINDALAPNNDIIDPHHRWEPDFLRRNPPGCHVANSHHGCLCSPDYEGITNRLLSLVKRCEGPLSRGKKIVVSIMDEPYYGLSMLTNCRSKVKTCRERYGRDFCFDPAKVREHLDTIAYRDSVVSGYYKTVTDIARSMDTNILISANVGISLVFGGNVCSPGTSPFMLADTDAISVGLTEDWSNVQRTRQFCSYICDVYRSAMRRKNLDFVMYSIILSDAETGAKAFSEVGHGVDGLYFFAYGPHWLAGDNRNRNPGMYRVLRSFCETMASAEDDIVGAHVAKGDAALLLSESCDRLEMVPGEQRNWIERNPYGKDRMCASLMLSHCGVRTDVLCEDDILKRLSGYRVLVATDRRVWLDCAKSIARWMRRGGVLVRTMGALSADEYDRPLPEGLFPSGRIVELDFSPWRDYVKPAKQTEGGCYSHRDFDMNVLAKMEEAVRSAKIRRRIHSDHHLVEAMLLENPSKRTSVVVLSNWSADVRRKVKVTLDRPPRFKSIRSVSGAKVKWRWQSGDLTLSLEIGLGDFLILK